MNLVELAQRIKNYRREQSLTLEEVATQTGLTRSWLSKVENFRVTPSLPALGKIAQALNITLADLVTGLDEKPEMILVRKNDRTKVERDSSPENHSVYEALAFKRQNRSMDPFIISIPANTSRKNALSHEGEEFLLVLSGEIHFEYGDDLYSLDEGDSLYFDAHVNHRILNKSENKSEVLCVFFQGV